MSGDLSEINSLMLPPERTSPSAHIHSLSPCAVVKRPRFSAVAEDVLPAAVCQFVNRQSFYLRRSLFFSPQEHSSGALPQRSERLLGFEHLGRIGKLRAIP